MFHFNDIFSSTLNNGFKKIYKATLIFLLLSASQITWANTIETAANPDNAKTHSVGQIKQTITNSERTSANIFETATITARTQKYQGMQREQVNLSRQKQTSKTINTPPKLLSRVQNQTNTNVDVYYSFSIYSAYSELITDIDEDGYYQTFSVSFDADIISSQPADQALVYADLYLSKNGEPWELYFSTDDFLITGENTDDEFEVITRIESGYIPDNYDVLIDLYEVGFSDIVATYSADNTNELYALPLESSDYDPEYVEEIEIIEIHTEQGGSTNKWFVALLLLLLIRRRTRHKTS